MHLLVRVVRKGRGGKTSRKLMRTAKQVHCQSRKHILQIFSLFTRHSTLCLRGRQITSQGVCNKKGGLRRSTGLPRGETANLQQTHTTTPHGLVAKHKPRGTIADVSREQLPHTQAVVHHALSATASVLPAHSWNPTSLWSPLQKL